MTFIISLKIKIFNIAFLGRDSLLASCVASARCGPTRDSETSPTYFFREVAGFELCHTKVQNCLTLALGFLAMLGNELCPARFNIITRILQVSMFIDLVQFLICWCSPHFEGGFRAP